MHQMRLKHLHGLGGHCTTANLDTQRAHHLGLLGVNKERDAPLTTGTTKGRGHRAIVIQTTLLFKLHGFVTLSTDKFHDTGLLAGSVRANSKKVRTCSPIWSSAC